MKPFRYGVVGCGRISNQYLTNLTQNFPATAVLSACSDLNLDAARSVADEFGAAKYCVPDEVYGDPDIDVVLNLTNPWAHDDVNLAAIAGGKHVYAEKPLSLSREGARKVLDAAAKADLRIGCAPDTFLGAGLQTCIKLINDGWIGEPVAAHASITMALRSSARYNSAGIGGVLMDMGPYYLTALVAMFGPARRVAGFARRSVTESTITNMASESYGETSAIEAPTAVAGTIEFDGVFAHLTTTVDSFKYGPALSVIGSEGVLTCNDPNMFGGPVIVERKGSEPRQMPLTHQYSDRNRGAGMVEMMAAVQAGRPHRASGQLAYHVMDIALSMIESGSEGRILELDPGCSRPEPLRPGHTENPFL